MLRLYEKQVADARIRICARGSIAASLRAAPGHARHTAFPAQIEKPDEQEIKL